MNQPTLQVKSSQAQVISCAQEMTGGGRSQGSKNMFTPFAISPSLSFSSPVHNGQCRAKARATKSISFTSTSTQKSCAIFLYTVSISTTVMIRLCRYFSTACLSSKLRCGLFRSFLCFFSPCSSLHNLGTLKISISLEKNIPSRLGFELYTVEKTMLVSTTIRILALNQ